MNVYKHTELEVYTIAAAEAGFSDGDVKLAIDTLLYHEPFSPADAEIPGGKDVFLLIRKIEGFSRYERDSFNDIFDDRDLEAVVNDIARRFKTAVIPQDVVFK